MVRRKIVFFFLSLALHAAILALPLQESEGPAEKTHPVAFLVTESASPVPAPTAIRSAGKYREGSAERDPKIEPSREPPRGTPPGEKAALPDPPGPVTTLPLERAASVVAEIATPKIHLAEAPIRTEPEAKPSPAGPPSGGLKEEAVRPALEAKANGNAAARGAGAAAGRHSAASESNRVFSQARYAHSPAPRYPEGARRQGLQGAVLLAVLVGQEGKAERIEVKRSSGYAILDEAARSAIRGWRFHPARDGESALRSWVNIPIIFRLAESGDELKPMNHGRD
ncbi:MAG: energy transducer TonB [Deltaproteobacteria bacterium]|nr:energy transducer TonB [Deltaproteobacteria bacterium]